MKCNEEELVQIRRQLHQIPEVGFKEFKTKAYLEEKLRTYGVTYKEVGATGLIAIVSGESSSSKVLGIRCDIDGLEVREETGLPFSSTHEGCMHGCAHDAHMAMQLMVVKWFSEHKHSFGGTIKFIFQPAEEYVRGARMMIDSGELDDVESFFGMHIWSDLPVGKVNIEEGPRMASVDMFTITVKGKGGHGSAPHQCVDALLVAAQIVTNLQSFVSREVSPFEPVALTIGKIQAGTANNVIAESARLEGTIRGFNNTLRNSYKEMLERICTNIARAHRAEAIVEFVPGAPVLINDTLLARMGQEAAKQTLGTEHVVYFNKLTASEDFAEYAIRKPSVYAFVGCRNEAEGKCLPHHNPRFDIDEKGMKVGVELAISYALAYLSQYECKTL